MLEDASVARVERWELYRLLAEPVRLKLLVLSGEDELAVSELSELLGESQPNVSRHAAPLRNAGLLTVRRQGTWTLLRLAEDAGQDPVVADALRAGRALCERDGSLSRVSHVVRAREQSTRDFFARVKAVPSASGPPGEWSAYLAAIAPLLPHRSLAIDAGAGDGRCLDLLAPLFERVVAVDRSEAQLALARERVEERHFANVTLVHGELDGPELRGALKGSPGGDVVLAARVLHHAPKPAETLRHLAKLARPGGAVIVLDYGRHQEESLRAEQADLWLGFEPEELKGFAVEAGLLDATVTRLPAAWCGDGPDRNVPWQVLVAHRGAQAPAARSTDLQPARVSRANTRESRR